MFLRKGLHSVSIGLLVVDVVVVRFVIDGGGNVVVKGGGIVIAFSENRKWQWSV